MPNFTEEQSRSLNNAALTQALKRIEHLIVRDAESVPIDPQERYTEFHRRLEHTRQFMTLLGDPQMHYDIFHIGGTSGKGSIAMIAEAVLQAAGLRVGTHTTPYLQTPLEKIRVDRTLVAPEQIITLVDWIDPYIGEIGSALKMGPVQYAEAWLALALTEFASRLVDVGVIEVGIGGRFDPTNILVPSVSIISTVHYDHMLMLGDTLEEIAYHKAGIIKDGVPVVIGDLPPRALSVVMQEAQLRSALVVRLGHDVRFEPHSVTEDGGRFTYYGLGKTLSDLRLSLLGEHQFANAALALAALELYAEATGLVIGEDAIRQGLENVHFAGRLEVVQHEPTVVLDGAHNEEKINALAAALPALFGHRRIVMLVGMLSAKTHALSMLQQLAGLADVIVTTAPVIKGKPALAPQELADLARRAGAQQVIVDGSSLEALDQVLALTGPDDVLCVTGSLYLVGEVRSHWYPVDALLAQQTMFPHQAVLL